MTYQKRLDSIRILLKDSAPELVSEGYDLLFNLWRENIDSPYFAKDLRPLAQENENLITELERRLHEFVTENIGAEIYINKQLNDLVSQISEPSIEKATNSDQNKTSQQQIVSTDTQVKKVPLWKNISLVMAIIVAIIVGSLDLIYVFPKNEQTISVNSLGLKFTYKAPIYLSQHDENVIDISVENPLSQNFEGTATLIIFDPESSTKPLPGEKSSTKLDIDSLGEESMQLKFIMTKKPSSRVLNYQLKISELNSPKSVLVNENFLIAPIPYLRTASNWLFGTVGTLIFALLWDQLKKRLGFN